MDQKNQESVSPETECDLDDICRWENEGGAVPPIVASGDESDVVIQREGDSSPQPTGRVSSLNRKAAVLNKPVYGTLARHQRGELDWDYHDLYACVDEWYDRFNDEFRLGLPRTPLRLDPTIRGNCAGYFRPDFNEFGLIYEIALKVSPPGELHSLDLGELLGTLLHEQLHLLQELTGVAGRNNYHNVQYRMTAERFGLGVDPRGYQDYFPDSPFTDLLHKHRVPLPRILQAKLAVAEGGGLVVAEPPPKEKTKSKLRKWTCGCTNVWVGVAVLHARCARSDCGKAYNPA